MQEESLPRASSWQPNQLPEGRRATPYREFMKQRLEHDGRTPEGRGP
jgi:hypothetical protein